MKEVKIPEEIKNKIEEKFNNTQAGDWSKAGAEFG